MCAQSCPALLDLIACQVSLHGISQAGILEWVAISYSNPVGMHLLKKIFFYLASIKAHLCELTALCSRVVFFFVLK